MIIKKLDTFNYHKLDRSSVNGKRLYETPSGPVPSVTTILSKTKDMSGLIAWRKRVGEEEANRVSKEATGLGTLMHQHLEDYVLNQPRPTGNNVVRKLAENMADVIIEQGLHKISEVYGVEASLYADGLWAGTADLICEHDGVLSVGDFKTTKKAKKKEWVEDYFLQLTAYSEAHNIMFGTNISKGVILMADRDCNYYEYIIEGDDYHFYKDKWLQRVADYNVKYGMLTE